MFNKETFIEQCKAVAHLEDSHKRIKVILEEALKTSGITNELGRPTEAGVRVCTKHPIYLFSILWAPVWSYTHITTTCGPSLVFTMC